MLASIHPLGERARGQRYAITVTAYTVGSVVGAAVLGGALGGAAQVVVSPSSTGARIGCFGLAAAATALMDRSRRSVPSFHRQVNEDWLTGYRGWVYGFGFGAQLGLGVITIVTTASVYLTWLGALLVADPRLGGLVGVAFGLARAAPLFTGESGRTTEAIAARVRTLLEWDDKFRTVTVGVEAVVAVVLIAVVVVPVVVH